MKIKLWYILSVIVVIFWACNDKEVYDPDAGKKVEDLKVPQGFDWKMTKDVKLVFHSNVPTGVTVYADKAASVVLAEMNVRPEGTTCFVNVGKEASAVYVKYTQENGKETIEPVAFSPVTRADADRANWIGKWEVEKAKENEMVDGIKWVAYYPSKNSCGTLLFEDMWPKMGDYDFNDVAVWYQIRMHSLKSKIKEPDDEIKDVKKIEIAVRLNALGGSYPCDFCLSFDEDRDDIEKIEVSDGVGTCRWENRDKKEDALFVFSWPGIKTERYYNTETAVSNDMLDKNWVLLTIWLKEDEDIEFDDFDFFIRRTDNQYEIHLKGYEPTKDFENRYEEIVRENEELNPDDDYAYMTKDGYVWGLNLPWAINHAKESVNFCDAYDGFAEWITSGGKDNQNWYKPNKDKANRVDMVPSNHGGISYFK